MSDLTLIIPAKNEKESLPRVLDELKKFNFKKNIILEASDKLTIEAINTYDCKIIYQDSRGYGDALKKGIETVETEFFCIFNADGSFNPNEIEGMMNTLDSNKNDFIFASRYEKNAGSEDDTLVTFIGNFIFSSIGRIFFNLGISDILYTFVIGDTIKTKKLNLQSNDFRFCVELPIKAKKKKFSLNIFPSFERKRIAGRKKVNALKDGSLILKKLIELYFI